MKRILCFGDSNTYGHLPADGSRMEMPWPKVLQRLMPDCEMIEEGLCGRTTAFDTEEPPLHNGMYRFRQLLEENVDADILILMLGTNDTLSQFDKTTAETVAALREYIHLWRGKNGRDKKILLISPIHITENFMKHEYFSTVYPPHAAERSLAFAPAYEQLAKEENTAFLNAALYCKTSPTDGIHMEPSEHEKLARAVYEKLQTM